jgi:hypothetical protein
MKEITDEEIKIMHFRSMKLQEQTEKLELMFSGRGKSILPYIQTEKGRYSEKKTWKLIRQLVSCLERYIQYVYEDRTYKLSQLEIEFYQSFLYCTIRGAAFDYPELRIMANCKTMDDICRMAADPGTTRIKNAVDLFFEELYEPVLDGFFGYMDPLYELLSGHPITDTIGEKERQQLIQMYEQKINEYKQDFEDYQEAMRNDFRQEGMTDEEVDAYIDEEEDRMAKWYWEHADEEERAQLTREQEDYDRIQAEKKAWASEFQYKEMFCRQYLRYRELYFKVANMNFEVNIKRMVEIFLYEEGLSHYRDEDDFLEAYTLLSRVMKQVNIPE